MKRDYLALWGLLASAFIIFLTLSAFGDEISVGPATLRTSGMAQELFGGDDTPAAFAMTDSVETAIADSIAGSSVDSLAHSPADSSAHLHSAAFALAHPEAIAADTVAAPKTSVPADSGSYTVLIVGDSMLEGLAPRLAAYCDASGYKLYSAIWYSSTSEIWGDARLLSEYIRKYRPNFIFICLGANELFVRDIAKKRDKHVKSILAEAGDIPYLWIGPPNWKPDTGINALVRDNAPAGRFFLSDGMKFDRQKDGAHPTSRSAIEWMDSVMRWMPQHCPGAPAFAAPTSEKSRPARQFMHKPGKTP